ncbi:hypothetical protein, partial [Salmonella enterica]|uniref:hypothetical protein n=1 Tax=Salmonella enterica TaxID=28901 RepID=UPI003D29B65B
SGLYPRHPPITGRTKERQKARETGISCNEKYLLHKFRVHSDDRVVRPDPRNRIFGGSMTTRFARRARLLAVTSLIAVPALL